MSERFHDLGFKRMPDGCIRLTQSECDEDSIIDLHPEQVLYVARRLCGLRSETAAQVADVERRISVLAERLESLVLADWFRRSIVQSCGDGVEIMCRLDAVLDLAVEFDGGRLEPEEQVPTANPNETQSKPNGFSGTPSSDAMVAATSGGEQLALIGE
jgi:hypothetical protein